MIKRLIFSFPIFILLSFTNLGFAQNSNCSCKTDLDFLNKKLQKLPAFKDNKKNYNDQFVKFSERAGNLNSGYECFVLLNELVLTLNDNHSRIFGIDKGATTEVRTDPGKLEEFKTSKTFQAYPKPKMDLDSLKTLLISKTGSEIEGVYSKQDHLVIGVYKNDKELGYKAVVLESKSEIWEPGEIIYTLIPFGKEYHLNVGGNIATKRLISYTERIEDGFFLTMGFQKDHLKTNYSVSLFPDSTYVRKEISPDITYLKIGSFNSWNPNLSEAETFYDSLEKTLSKDHLIIDLRDNTGGGDRNSDILYKIVKRYLRDNKVYIITNHRTASNAEQFAFKLSKLKNSMVFGARTNGSAAYELEGNSFNLPCNNYMAVLATKRHSKYLEIESTGIEPDVEFNMETDWLEQMRQYIELHK